MTRHVPPNKNKDPRMDELRVYQAMVRQHNPPLPRNHIGLRTPAPGEPFDPAEFVAACAALIKIQPADDAKSSPSAMLKCSSSGASDTPTIDKACPVQ